MRRIKYIVIHHTGGDWGSAEVINHWHTDPPPNGNGWSKPGYHYVINNGFPTYRSHYENSKTTGWDGKVEELVREEQTSNGVLGFNHSLINICLVGNFDINIPTPAQTNSLELICKHLCKKYKLEPSAIIGHHDAIRLREKRDNKRKKDHNKTCPGNRIYELDVLDDIRDAISNDTFFFLDDEQENG